MTSTTATTATAGAIPEQTSGPTLAEQAPALVGLLAGYAGHRTVEMGLRHGLVRELADAGNAGLDVEELAERTGFDPFYLSVWLRSAVAAGVCDRIGNGYRLAPHMATLLLDTSSPAYIGGVFVVMSQHEMFGRFSDVLPSGERMWWADTSPEWIAAVSTTGTPFYTRLVPGGLAQVPGLMARLEEGGLIVDTASGAGTGAIRLAQHFPRSTVVGVDGDAHSIQVATQQVQAAGLTDRVTFVHSPLEEMSLSGSAALVTNNISMHECRDADRVVDNVLSMLEPRGWFVISDFPFPDTDEGLRTGPGRVMSAIQFFEAQIDDQLLPRSAYDELLGRHGFVELGSVQLTPMHALTWGRRPAE
jgi:SAM-dependent methyltransferase